jgi:hypothetical protein
MPLSRTFARILATLALTTLAFAVQEPNEVQKLNRDVIADITAKKYDDALVKLDKVLTLIPKDRGTAYNLACVQSLKGDVDKAAEWAGKSIEWGWGAGWGSIAGQEGKELTEVEMLEQDADLENLRKDARWPAILERSKALRKAVDAERSTAAVYIPEKVAALPEKPLLIVLHDNGSTKEAVISGRWKQIADELGCALVAPSGRYLAPRSNTPKDGMFWIRDPASYQARPWTDERPVQDAYTEFSKTNKIDKARVLVAGDGPVGGIAINVAAASPYLYKGALSVGGVLMTPVVSGKAANVAKAGTRLEVLLEQKAALDALGSAEAVERVVKTTNADLSRWGIGGSARTYARDEKDPDLERKLIVERLKAILDAPRPTEAAATPK